jgi:signal transduction histidine kinase
MSATRPVASTDLPATARTEPARHAAGSMNDQLVDIFFDRVPMGVAVFDRDARLVRCNRTWAGFFIHYLGVTADYVTPGRTLHELIPDNEEAIAPLLAAVLAGQTVRQAAHRLSNGTVTTYWDVVFAPIFAHGVVDGFVDVVTDATDRVLAYDRLEQRVQALTRITAGLTVDQPLEVTLRQVVAAADTVPGAAGASIISWGTATGRVDVYADESFPAGYEAALRQTWAAVHPGDAAADTLPTIAIMRGFRTKALSQHRFTCMRPLWVDAGWDDVVVVPLSAQGRSFGELHVYLPAGTEITGDDEAFLTALADQAAVAAQNADLFGAAQQNATLLERQRLARELHDSVSQALFSMTLHARTAQRHLAAAGIHPGEPASVEVDRIRALTQGALAEMRALIFELRPGALAEEGLVAALRKQAAAIGARTGLTILVHGPAERPVIDPAVEEHLYRMALEALNNAVKHAQATEIRIEITSTAEDLMLTVTDDGVGFDTTASAPGHLGQHTMRERAHAAGGTLQVSSSPGHGTVVRAVVPALRHPAEN